MEVSPPSEAACSSPSSTGDAVSSLPQPYHGNLMNNDEKPVKLPAAGNGNGNGNVSTPSFQSSAAPETPSPPPSHSTNQAQHPVQGEPANMASSYHVPTTCPVNPNNNNEDSTNANVDNAKYSFSSNQNQCPYSGSISAQAYAANQNVYPARDSQSPCPWKLNGGAKVLVRLEQDSTFLILTNQFCRKSDIQRIKKLFLSHLISWRSQASVKDI